MTQALESWPWTEARYQGAEQRSSCPWTGGGFPGSCCCFFPPEWEVGDVHPPRAPCGKGTCRGRRELGQWSHAPSYYRSPRAKAHSVHPPRRGAAGTAGPRATSASPAGQLEWHAATESAALPSAGDTLGRGRCGLRRAADAVLEEDSRQGPGPG